MHVHVRCLALLGLVLAASSPPTVAEPGSSFSLSELNAMARSVHPTLDSAEAAVVSAHGILRQARAYSNPELTVTYGRGRPRDGGEARAESRIDLVQSIEFPGIRRWRLRAAELRLRGIEVDRIIASTVIDTTVARLVYAALLGQRRAEIAQESAAVAARLHELLQHRVGLGESSPLEAVKARTEWFARRRELLDATGTLAAARSVLRLFCGSRLPDDYEIAETLEDPDLRDLPGNLINRLRTSNPLLLRAGIAEEEAEARTEVTRKEAVPGLAVGLGHETELDRVATSVGVGLTIPLWNRNRGSIAAATADEAGAVASRRALVLDLETSLAQASAAYGRALDAVQLHEEGWTAAAREALDIATFSFEHGEASLLEVLDAQRSYLGVSLAEAESWAWLALARTDIEGLIAGPLAREDHNEDR